jgi:hypothetical protein
MPRDFPLAPLAEARGFPWAKDESVVPNAVQPERLCLALPLQGAPAFACRAEQEARHRAARSLALEAVQPGERVRVAQPPELALLEPQA